jgi:hypothetical protein
MGFAVLETMGYGFQTFLAFLVGQERVAQTPGSWREAAVC